MRPHAVRSASSNDAASEMSDTGHSVRQFMMRNGGDRTLEQRIEEVVYRMIAEGKIKTCQHDEQFVQALDAMTKLQFNINAANNLTFTMLNNIQQQAYQNAATPPSAPTPPPTVSTPPTSPANWDNDVVMLEGPEPENTANKTKKEYCPNCQFYINPINHAERCQARSSPIPPRNEHASMSWTACYDDDCYVHQSEKEGANWFPQRPRTRRSRRSRASPSSPPTKYLGTVLNSSPNSGGW